MKTSLQELEAAVDKFFGDTKSRSRSQTRDDLEALIEHIQPMIDSILDDEDIQDERDDEDEPEEEDDD